MSVGILEEIGSGKSKSLYRSEETPGCLVVEFRDDATAFDGEKKASLSLKGMLNHLISSHIMQLLASEGVPTHFVKTLSSSTSLVKSLDMLPIECVVRNVAAGSICRRLGLEQGLVLEAPLYELFYKDDALHDPLICEDHALAFGWANQSQLNEMRKLTLKINEILTRTFSAVGLVFVDTKFEFGLDAEGQLCLGDEISPDSSRIWDASTNKPLDKDRFRHDMGDVISSYQEIAARLGVEIPSS